MPPFTLDAAVMKVRAAEVVWNGRDPVRVALAYLADSRSRNRTQFLEGREAIEAFLRSNWEREM